MTDQTIYPEDDKKSIHFGIGHPSLAVLPNEIMAEAATHCFAQDDPEMLNYGPFAGDYAVRQPLADFLQGHYEMPVMADHLFMCGGISQGLDFICARYTEPGDVVLVSDATYFLAFQIFRDHGLQVFSVTTDGDGLRMDALEEAVRRHRPKLVYTIPAHHNPLTVTLSAERRQRLADLSELYQFYVAADEVYHLLNYSGKMPPPLAAYNEHGRIFSLGSFSKILAPGVRLGWIQASPAEVKNMMGCGMIISGGGMNHLTGRIIGSALQLGLQEKYLARLRRLYTERIDLMDQLLHETLPAGSVWRKPTGGYFMWVQLPKGMDTAEISQKAADFGVGFQHGAKFGDAPELKHAMRLCFAYYEEERMREGMDRLGQLLALFL